MIIKNIGEAPAENIKYRIYQIAPRGIQKQDITVNDECNIEGDPRGAGKNPIYDEGLYGRLVRHEQKIVGYITLKKPDPDIHSLILYQLEYYDPVLDEKIKEELNGWHYWLGGNYFLALTEKDLKQSQNCLGQLKLQ